MPVETPPHVPAPAQRPLSPPTPAHWHRTWWDRLWQRPGRLERADALSVLCTLSVEERLAFTLHEIACVPTEGVAQLMGVEPVVARRWLFDARERLLPIVMRPEYGG